VAAVASLGAPLITSVATTFHVSLDSAQWTLTVALLSGAVATPVLGRLGAGPHRRATILATLAVVVVGSALTVLPLPFAGLLIDAVHSRQAVRVIVRECAPHRAPVHAA
jgi:predicted MFS family arabinose efflux permease